MFVLTVTAKGSCDNANLSPNNRLIWKIYKPKGEREKLQFKQMVSMTPVPRGIKTHMSYNSLPAEAVLSELRSMMYISYCKKGEFE